MGIILTPPTGGVFTLSSDSNKCQAMMLAPRMRTLRRRPPPQTRPPVKRPPAGGIGSKPAAQGFMGTNGGNGIWHISTLRHGWVFVGSLVGMLRPSLCNDHAARLPPDHRTMGHEAQARSPRLTKTLTPAPHLRIP